MEDIVDHYHDMILGIDAQIARLEAEKVSTTLAKVVFRDWLYGLGWSVSDVKLGYFCVLPIEILYNILSYIAGPGRRYFHVCTAFTNYFQHYPTDSQANFIFCTHTLKQLRYNIEFDVWGEYEFSAKFLDHLKVVGLVNCMRMVSELRKSKIIQLGNVTFSLALRTLIITTPATGKFLLYKRTTIKNAIFVSYETDRSHTDMIRFKRGQKSECFSGRLRNLAVKRKMIRKLKKQKAFLVEDPQHCQYNSWKECKAAGITREVLYFSGRYFRAQTKK